MPEKEISQAVIGRMPRYFRYVKELKEEGRSRISSRELSDIMNVTASQIRQDFNNFGGFGQQGYGYNIDFLYDELHKILGLDKARHMIVVGYGNLAKALVGNSNFSSNGFSFDAGFDIEERVAEAENTPIPLFPVSELESYIEDHIVDIAVITIPKSVTEIMVSRLVKAGIKAIWNFSPVDLNVPDDVTVENVHLQDSLMILSNNADNNEKEKK